MLLSPLKTLAWLSALLIVRLSCYLADRLNLFPAYYKPKKKNSIFKMLLANRVGISEALVSVCGERGKEHLKLFLTAFDIQIS